MSGPAAPKDPEKARPYFYIIKDKEIFGTKQDDGTGIQFIYESDGRLISSAQITGNITDEHELKLLETVEGFAKLIHSIGVSVETENPKEPVEFVFQMYGKKDLYGGGTNLRTELKCDGMEQKIYLADYTWTEDDHIPGQIKIIFKTPEQMGRVSVRFFLNDGYDAPPEIKEEAVNTKSEAYCNMISRSLMNLGNTYRIRKAIEKSRAGKEVTLAYIGGSITQGAGATPINTECYAYKSFQLFQKRFAARDNVKFIKAGVGGTPSELGMIRFDRDVLRNGEQPDIVVIEFAVNDEGDETKGNCYESLVRKVLKLPWKPAVVLLFSVFANDWNLQERLSPVGKLYDLPMVSIRNAVTPQFFFKKEEGRVISKNQFFYDMFHPDNIGHTIMADCLQYMFERCDTAEHARIDTFSMGMTEEEILGQNLLKNPAIGADFEQVILLDRKENKINAEIDAGGFTGTDTELQSVEMDTELIMTPEFPYNWMYDGTKSKETWFQLTINCKSLFLVFKDSGEVDVGKAKVFVDGGYCLTADPHINNWQHCNAVLLFREKESMKHEIRIEMDEKDTEKKFTILGFGYVA
ncbi:MAG: SGNH/GDSL hydrolase family protein [Roseburia sp.]